MTACVAFIYLSLGDFERAQLWFDRAAQLTRAGTLPRYYREFTAFVLRREDPNGLLAVLRDIPAGQVFTGLGTRIFRKPALGTGERAGIEAFYRQFWPELFAAEPLVTVDNYGPASDVAWLLLGAGERGRAESLLTAALEIHRDPAQRSLLPPEWGLLLVEVEALALQGRKAEALAALRRAVDAGWRWEWWQVETDPTLESIRAEPAFVAMIDEVKADVARQLERVRELERNGTIPAPLPVAAAPAAAPTRD
jgi:tetratricopeptide (TPR) repeat protein